jgi:hypothetical protein
MYSARTPSVALKRRPHPRQRRLRSRGELQEHGPHQAEALSSNSDDGLGGQWQDHGRRLITVLDDDLTHSLER